ncbi:YcnI family protein [soil metagenome]
MNRFARVSVALAAGATLALAAPLAASAHVTIDDNTAAAGSFALITFKVPNESATESTAKVEVTLPSDTPLAYVSYVPVPGWTAELTTTTLDTPVEAEGSTITEAVTKVTWTADPGSEITDGQLQLFPLSVGPIPDTGSIVLPVDQTYSDGTVVSWSETGEDAEHPAPVLYINDAPAADHHSDGDDDHDTTTIDVADPDAPASASSSDDVLARILGIGGLVLGAVGIVVGIAGRRKTTAE